MTAKLIVQLYSIGAFLIITSCRKDIDVRMQEADGYVGVYSCQVKKHHWNISNGSQDSSYFEEVEITRLLYDIVFLGKNVVVDSLSGGNEYKELVAGGYFSVRFMGDSLYFQNYYASNGASTKLSYSGKKN